MSAPRRPAPLLATMVLAAFLLVACLALAVGGAIATVRYIPSLNQVTPILSQVSPRLGPPPPRLARRVILVIIDGLRLDASYGRPTLDGLRARGVGARATAEFPSLSRPGYVAIATGVPPRWSGVRTNDYPSIVQLDSVMARARSAGMEVSFASDSSPGFAHMFAWHLSSGVITPWPRGLELVAKNILERGEELVVLLPNDVDIAGHGRGAQSREYRDAVGRVDEMLGRLLADFDYAQDAVVVVGDHGHLDRGGHGGVEKVVLNVPLIMAGAGVRAGATILDARLVDVAPTVAALLGLPAPGHALGRTLVDALEMPRSVSDALERQDTTRIAYLDSVLDASRREYATDLEVVRIRRLGGTLTATAALIVFVTWAARRRIIIVDRRILLIGVPAFPATFYGLLSVLEQFLSPSMLPGEGSVATKLFIYGAGAAGVTLVSSWMALVGRLVPRQRLAAAAGLVLVGLATGLPPAALAWSVTGAAYRLALPQGRELILPPITYSAVTCFAVAAAVVLAVEYVFFMARALDPVRARRESRPPPRKTNPPSVGDGPPSPGS